MYWNFDKLDKEIEQEEKERERKEEQEKIVDLYTITCEEYYHIY